MSEDMRSLTARSDLGGRHAIVTGAASGLGLAICAGLLEFGASVTGLDVDEAALDVAAGALGPGRFTPVVCDIGERGAVARAISEAAARLGRLDAAFANAGVAGGEGIDRAGRLDTLDWDAFDRTLAINLTGTLATIRAAADAMRPAGRGSIVATVSTAGLRGESMVGYGYNASKGALTNLVRQAAIDLARDGIRVNGIAPGPIRTNIGGAGPVPADVEARWGSTVLLGRMGWASEIQGLANLLASDASSFMTGSVIPVDGGATTGYFATLPERA